jgi:hypothetical protein
MTVRRLKTYAGSQGYVYQYYFVGKQRVSGNVVEYTFEVSSDGRITYPVLVILPEDALATWAQAHRRPVTDTEQYAAAKLRLFRAFDELENTQLHGKRLQIDAAFLEQALASLGVE